MAQKKGTPIPNSGSNDHLSMNNNNKNVSQASVAALNALAAAYSLTPTTYPAAFYPYSMLPFGLTPPLHPAGFMADFPHAATGFPFWPGMMSPDYLLNMATLQSLQSPPLSNGNVESFSDVLRKMPRPPSSSTNVDKETSNDVKSPVVTPNETKVSSKHHHLTKQQSSSSLFPISKNISPSYSSTNNIALNNASTLSPRISLATLAEVATSLTAETSNDDEINNKQQNRKIKDEKYQKQRDFCSTSTRTKKETTTTTGEEEILDFSRKRPRTSTSRDADDFDQPPKVAKHCQNSSKSSNVVQKRTEHHSSSLLLNNNDKKLTNSISASASSSSVAADNSRKKAASSSTDLFTGNLKNLGTSLSSDLKMDPNLLNASAMAWAALSNQILLAAGMQNELLRTKNNNNNVNNHNNINNVNNNNNNSSHNNINNRTDEKDDRRRDKQGPNSNSTRFTVEENKIVVDCGGSKDSVDDTINAVIRSKMHGGVVGNKSRGRRSRNVRSSASTVREQLALRRAQDEASTTTTIDDVNVLDLSVKMNKQTSSSKIINCQPKEETSSNDECHIKRPTSPDCDDNICDLASKKRRIAETDLVRLPLTKGWRRQTCIRAISASGIRGDVIYYAPCGRRLGSYAEVVRYMNKNKIRDIGREHFSFSCKVLVGEFLHIRPNNYKNGIVPLSEDEVREMVQKFQVQPTQQASPTPLPVASTSTTHVESTSLEKQTKTRTSSRRRGRPVSGGVPVYSSSPAKNQDNSDVKLTNVKNVDGEGNSPVSREDAIVEKSRKLEEKSMQNNSALEALRSTEKELRRNQMEMLRKQEEEYMRQVMILADWEREKTRQQVLFARALEAKRREEEREQILAEKLIREEERLAARNAYLQKMKQQRLPNEDLDLEENKPLLNLNRIDNLSLDGQTFADLLMVMEFVRNFGHVLKINADEIPSLSDVHAGLFNDKKYLRCLLTLAKILLILVLEYPGLPNGQYGKTFLGLPAKDCTVNFDNLSELMRMFLQTRGDEGKKLADLFMNQPYETLSPSDKVATLAFMCNELLYCRNVVREIETNIDVSAKLRSDKWTLEGKIKHLKAVQASKQCDKNRSSNNNMSSTANDSPSKSTEKKSSTSTNVSDDEKHDCDDDETLEKVRLKMIAESEPISTEEKNMSVEEVDTEVDRMNKELDDITAKMMESSVKVRSLPLGQDRYYRHYWSLSSVGGVLVESLESAGVDNPTVPRSLRPPAIRPTEIIVGECVKNMVDAICDDENDGDLEVLKRKYDHSAANCDDDCKPSCSNSCGGCEFRKRPNNKKSIPPIDADLRHGWWLIRTEEELNSLQQTFNTHGIRERILNRTLPKCEEYLKRVSFDEMKLDLLSIGAKKSTKQTSLEFVALAKMKKVFKRLKDLEEKVFVANVHVKSWKPPDFYKANNNTNSNSATTDERNSDSSNSTSRSDSPVSSSDDCSRLSTSSAKASAVDYNNVDRLAEIIRKRLLQLEQNVERRYFHPTFNRTCAVPISCSTSAAPSAVESRDTSRRSSVVASEVSGDDTLTSIADCQQQTTTTTVVSADEDEESDEVDDVTPALHRWRSGVSKASTAAQLTMCVESLDAHIAWERSVMKASCQICRRGDDDSHLLLCDGCDLGYHTYCFKPKLETIPEGDWYCPECISKATRRPCCLLCCRQTTTRPMIVCVDCQRNFHTDCVDTTTTKKQSRNGWICDGCSASKSNPETTSKNKSANNSPSKKSKKSSKSGAKNHTQDKRNNSSSSTKFVSPTTFASSTTVCTNSPLQFNELCSIILAELDAHKDSWPFKQPVDVKVFPLYKKIIKHPMDLTMIQAKLNGQKYENADQFVNDLKLIFDNCKTFNEDDSPVGKAGHNLRRFFNKRWRELKDMSSRKN